MASDPKQSSEISIGMVHLHASPNVKHVLNAFIITSSDSGVMSFHEQTGHAVAQMIFKCFDRIDQFCDAKYIRPVTTLCEMGDTVWEWITRATVFLSMVLRFCLDHLSQQVYVIDVFDIEHDLELSPWI